MTPLPATRGALDGWRPVLAAGALATLAVFVVWGSLNSVPVYHDEWAYWLQADQYAHLHWKVASPPVPEFFEQLYVLVTPVFAAKYPPGYALMIAPGFALGIPALVPLLVTGATGALVFALARRVTGSIVGALTWALWLGTSANLRYRAAYLSETTTSFCWLLAWWALLEWRATRRTRWMVVLALSIGWGAITRPATMFVFAIPVGLVVVRDVMATKRWRQVAIGVATGVLVLGVLPLWSAETTGSWRTTPLALYTRQYLPFDVPGFTLDETPPQRGLPPEMERMRSRLHDVKKDQVVMPIAVTALIRVVHLLGDTFGAWRLPFLLALVIGFRKIGAAGWFAVGTSGLLIAAHLLQAHNSDWLVYYLEVTPVLAFTAAVGVTYLVGGVRSSAVPRWVGTAAGLALLGLLVSDVTMARGLMSRTSAGIRRFREEVAQLPKKPNLVFVRYAPERYVNIALVENRGMLQDAASWIVHDRGADDLRMSALATGRTAYLFDEATGRFYEVRP